MGTTKEIARFYKILEDIDRESRIEEGRTERHYLLQFGELDENHEFVFNGDAISEFYRMFTRGYPARCSLGMSQKDYAERRLIIASRRYLKALEQEVRGILLQG